MYSVNILKLISSFILVMICGYKLLKYLFSLFYIANFYILLLQENMLENILNFIGIIVSLIIILIKNNKILHYTHVTFIGLLLWMTLIGTSKYNLILYNIVILTVLATRFQYKKCLLKSLHNKLPKSYNNIFRYTHKNVISTDLLCILLSFIITLKIFYLYLL